VLLIVEADQGPPARKPRTSTSWPSQDLANSHNHSPLPRSPTVMGAAPLSTVDSCPAHLTVTAATPVLDLTDFKRDLSELTDRLGHAQDCL